jgi:hypothetical protein
MDANPYAPPGAALDLPSVPVESAPPLWNPDAAGAWSLLLTPIFGSTLVWRNWVSLGERSMARLALFWLAMSVLALAFAILATSRISLPYILLWYFACQRPQTLHLKRQWGTTYPRKPWLVPILSTLGGIVLFSLAVGALQAMWAR